MQSAAHTYGQIARWVEICRQHGIMYAVLSPGSRSAPLALSFLRNTAIQCYIIPDERSAAYVALGISKQTQAPVALACTSGTAALNYGPAIAEAYFSEAPLIVFTADRPPEWLGQADNQAVYQERIYGRHAKAFFTMPVELAHKDAAWQAERQVNEALLIATASPKGPVHINVPLREPLYLENEIEAELHNLQVMQAAPLQVQPGPSLLQETDKYKKIAVVAGMYPPDVALMKALSQLNGRAALLADITSNLIGTDGAIPFAELILDTATEEELNELAPDLVISFGGPVVSKRLKQFLRESSCRHWQLGKPGHSADTFQKLEKVIDCAPAVFFAEWAKANHSSATYTRRWRQMQERLKIKATIALNKISFSEISFIHKFLRSLPANCVLHLGNSLPVRYASVFPFMRNDIEIYANRGASGIDGSLSTAAGHSMADGRMHLLLTGDLSLLYDSNGLWNNYIGGNLRIAVLNNHGGGIFRQLPGPVMQKELEEYFVVKQPLGFQHLAAQFGCGYRLCNSQEDIGPALEELFAPADTPQILEVGIPVVGPSIREVRSQVKALLTDTHTNEAK